MRYPSPLAAVPVTPVLSPSRCWVSSWGQGGEGHVWVPSPRGGCRVSDLTAEGPGGPAGVSGEPGLEP